VSAYAHVEAGAFLAACLTAGAVLGALAVAVQLLRERRRR
jgi:hypothetical protein